MTYTHAFCWLALNNALKKILGMSIKRIFNWALCVAVCAFTTLNAESPLLNQEKPFIHVDFDECVSYFGGYNADYSEFTGVYTDNISCTDMTLVGGSVYRRNPAVNTHSCTPGQEGIAMCISGMESCDFVPDNDRALRFDILVNPGANGFGSIDEISFYSQAPENFNFVDGVSGPNNYPTLMAVRVMANGVEVFRETDITTTRDWSLSSFDFTSIPGFTIESPTLFNFEILPYCLVGVSSSIKAWDIDELTITGGCNEVNGGLITLEESTSICYPDSQDTDAIREFDLELELGSNFAWLVVAENNNIITISDSSSVDFSTYGNGVFTVYHIAYDSTDIQGLVENESLEDLEGCFDLSNGIQIFNNDISVGELNFSGSDASVICSSDSTMNIVEFELSGAIGVETQYILLDSDSIILEITDLPSIDLNAYGEGTYHVVAVVHNGGLFNAIEGMSFTGLMGCFVVTNTLDIEKSLVEGGTISFDGDDMFQACETSSFILEPVIQDTMGGTSRWVLYTPTGIIIATYEDTPIDISMMLMPSLRLVSITYAGSITGLTPGEDLDDVEGCFDLSNTLTIDIPVVDGGTIDVNGQDSINVCLNNPFESLVNVNIEGVQGTAFSLVVTDENGEILSIPGTDTIDFSGGGSGVCYIWNIAFANTLDGFEVGMSIDSVIGCFDLSNSIAVNRVSLEPAMIDVNGGLTSIEICSGDNVSDSVFVSVGSFTGPFSTLVVTDSLNNVLEVPTTDTLDFEGVPEGLCFIYHLVSTSDSILSGTDLNVDSLDGCYALSNAVAVSRNEVDGGSIMTVDSLTEVFIVIGDGSSTIVHVNLEATVGDSSIWVLTDTLGVILEIQDSGSFDFENYPPGVCLIWHISYAELSGLEIGEDVANLSGCFDISNSVSVNKVTLDGGVIEFDNGLDSISLCTGDQFVDTINVNLTGEEGPLFAWIITDTAGIILELPVSPPFIFDDTPGGTCLIWHAAYTSGIVGLEQDLDIDALSGSFNLSDPLTVIRNFVSGGDIMTTDSLTQLSICTGDGVSDSIDVIINNIEGENTAWIITDTTGLILELPTGPPFDFEGVEPGVCQIYHVAYTDSLTNLEVDSTLSDLEGCFDLSNAITVSRFEVDGGIISEASGLDTLTVVIGEGIVDSFSFSVIDAVGDSLRWIVTDSSGIILEIDTIPPVEFESSGDGVCQVYHIAYGSDDIGLVEGADINTLIGCYDLSNAITIVKTEVNGGMIMTVDSLTVVDLCIVDSISVPVDVTLVDEVGTNFQWVITDDAGNILELPMAPPFDFSDAPTGVCQIWHLASIDTVANLTVGNNISMVTGVFDLSNAITVNREQVSGGTISHMTGTDTLTFITNDGISDLVDLDLTDQVGDSSHWVITDTLGQIIALPDTLPYDFEGSGVGVCLIWNISFNTVPQGLEVDSLVSQLDGCFDLSNSFTVIKEEINGGLVMTLDSSILASLCLNDTLPNMVDVILSADTLGMNFAWLITNTSGEILDLPVAPPFDFSNSSSGICQIWHLAYQDNLTGLTVGSFTSDLTGSFNFSNPIEVIKDSISGGILTLEDGTVLDSIIVGDGVIDTITLDLSQTVSTNNLFVVTDTFGLIQDTTTLSELNLENNGGGICLIWNLAYNATPSGLEIGNNVSDLMGCFDFSNPVTIVKEGLMGGVLTTVDGETETQVCLSDTLDNLIDFVVMNASGPAFSWVITDTSGIILDLPTAPPFDMGIFGLDECQVWHLSHDPGITGLTLGSDIDSLSGNHHFSNPVTVSKVSVVGSQIMTTDSLTAITITVGEGVTDLIDVISEGGDSDSTIWIITEDNGDIIGLPTAPPFDLESGGGGVCLIYQLNFTGTLSGVALDNNIDDIAGCYELSNAIEVTRVATPLDGGFLTTTNFLTALEICVGNGMAPAIDVTLSGNEGPNFQWVISDTSGLILGLPSSPPFDLNLAGPGLCQIRNISFSNGIMGLTVGANVDSLVGFYDFSNAINVTRNAADGGVVQTPGGLIEVTIPVGEGAVDSVDVVLTGNDGEFQQWIITDDEGEIIDINSVPPFTFEESGGGVCLIYNLSYSGMIMGLEIGNNITELDGCFDLSNAFIVNKDGLNGGELTALDGTTMADFCFTSEFNDSLEVILTDTIGTDFQWIVSNTSGEIISLPASAPIDLNGLPTGTCLLYNVAYDTEPGGLVIGDTLTNLTGIYHLSNALMINKAEVEGGSLTYADGTTLDSIEVGEGVVDTINVLLSGSMGTVNQWVVTDTFGLISNLPATAPFNFENEGGGVCLIWNISFEPGLQGLQVGSFVDQLDGCYSFSNPITLVKEGLSGGLLTFDDMTLEREICFGDGIADPTTFVVQGVQGTTQQFVITQTSGQITSVNTPNPFNFEVIPVNIDSFYIYSIAYDTLPGGYNQGAFLNNLTGSFDLSNPILLTRNIQKGGTIADQNARTDTTLIVAEGMIDTLTMSITGAFADSLVWVVADTNNIVTEFHDSNVFIIDSTASDICYIYHIGYDTLEISNLQIGSDLDSLGGCYGLSNRYTLTKIALNGGTISTTAGETSIDLCLGDDNPDIVNVVRDGELGEQFVYIVVNTAGFILLNQTTSQLDLSNVQPGMCQIFNLSHDGTLGGLANGVNLVNLTGTFILSNPIDVTKNSVFGGNLSFSSGGGTSQDVCVQDGIDDDLIWQTTSTVPSNYAYAITDTFNVIDTIITTTVFNFDNNEVGVCRIWGFSYVGNITASQGDTVGVTELVDDCFDVSNDFLTVNKMDCTKPSLLEYTIYPNPVADMLNIDLINSYKEISELMILDSNGKIIHSARANKGYNNFDVSSLQGGIYYIRIKSGSYTKTEKFVILR